MIVGGMWSASLDELFSWWIPNSRQSLEDERLIGASSIVLLENDLDKVGSPSEVDDGIFLKPRGSEASSIAHL